MNAMIRTQTIMRSMLFAGFIVIALAIRRESLIVVGRRRVSLPTELVGIAEAPPLHVTNR